MSFFLYPLFGSVRFSTQIKEWNNAMHPSYGLFIGINLNLYGSHTNLIVLFTCDVK